jgi:hypothetical protein
MESTDILNTPELIPEIKLSQSISDKPDIQVEKKSRHSFKKFKDEVLSLLNAGLIEVTAEQLDSAIIKTKYYIKNFKTGGYPFSDKIRDEWKAVNATKLREAAKKVRFVEEVASPDGNVPRVLIGPNGPVRDQDKYFETKYGDILTRLFSWVDSKWFSSVLLLVVGIFMVARYLIRGYDKIDKEDKAEKDIELGNVTDYN